MLPGVGCTQVGEVVAAEPLPPSLPAATDHDDPSSISASDHLTQRVVRVGRAVTGRTPGVVDDADRGADLVVVVEHPLQRFEPEWTRSGSRPRRRRGCAGRRAVNWPPEAAPVPATMPATCVPWPPRLTTSVSAVRRDVGHGTALTLLATGREVPCVNHRSPSRRSPRRPGAVEDGAVEAGSRPRRAPPGRGWRHATSP